jgi:hypothetical protein
VFRPLTPAASPRATTVRGNPGGFNDVFHFLGASEGRIAWTNPASTNRLRLLSSSVFSGQTITRVTDRTTNDFYTNEDSPSWLAVDLVHHSLSLEFFDTQGRSDQVYPLSHFTLQATNYLELWTVAGINAATWTTVQEFRQDLQAWPTAATASAWSRFRLNKPSTRFRYWRWVAVPRDGIVGLHGCCELMLYGRLRRLTA